MWRKIVDLALLPLAFVAMATALSLSLAEHIAHDEERIAQFTPTPEEEEPLISQYDKMLQEVGEQYGVDWLLLSAIARAEYMASSSEENQNSVTAITDSIDVYKHNINKIVDDNIIISQLSASLLESANQSIDTE